MEVKDYLKSKKIWLGTKVADMNAPENYFELEHLLEDYHQAKLKLLSIADVVGRSEQLFCDEHTPKVRYDWQKGNCLTCAKKLEAK